MNFFTILIGTCKGTNIFSQLLSQSLIRALWHLALLVLICSLFIIICTYPANSQRVSDAFSQIKNTFGDIKVSEKGILPTDPETAKSLLIAGKTIRVNYFPAIDKNTFSEIDTDEVNSGFLWTPLMIASWFKTGKDDFLIIPFAYFSENQLLAEHLKRSLITPYIKTNSSLKNKLVSDYSALNWPALNDYFRMSFISILFFTNLIGIFWQVLFFAAVFSFILNLSKGANPIPVLKYKQRFIIGIYASFPPLLIASMFSAFELPYLGFNSVYVICFSIYLITVYTRLQLDYNAGNTTIK